MGAPSETCTREEQQAVISFLGGEREKPTGYSSQNEEVVGMRECRFRGYMNGTRRLKVECQIWRLQLDLSAYTADRPNTKAEVE